MLNVKRKSVKTLPNRSCEHKMLNTGLSTEPTSECPIINTTQGNFEVFSINV